MHYDSQSEVAIHFNCSFHILNKDIVFYITDKNLDITRIRKSKETDLINVFKFLKIKIMNKKIPNYKYVTNLFFYEEDQIRHR